MTAILLVEDNDDDVELMLRALRGAAHRDRITRVSDGVGALDYLFGRGVYAGRAVDPLPSIVFLDLRLPRLDGIDVLTQLRADARTAVLPVVMLTTSMEHRDRLAAYKQRVNSYVQKPVDYDEFVKLVRSLVHYWTEINVAPR